ncbi:MAG: hypothetical protein WCP53_14050 [Verrucomicrobiota bacterium]
MEARNRRLPARPPMRRSGSARARCCVIPAGPDQAACHRIGEDGVRPGPELTGAGKHGVRCFLENVIDPVAVVGADF